jgi:prepilin-type N-terminal cleavage/methylation domain-containing protein
MTRVSRKAFTLVEILIVVIILGILAAIVVPQMLGAANDSAVTATYNELNKLRNHVQVYRAFNNGDLPNVVAGDGTWGEIVTVTGEYLKAAPTNAYVGGANGRVITLANTPDVAFQTAYGWIFDPATGNVWAGSFDGNDMPIPQP